MIRKLFFMLCAFSLCLSLAWADDASETVSYTETTVMEFGRIDSTISNDSLAEKYILRAFGLLPSTDKLLQANTVPLSGANRLLYDKLVEIVQQVAAGKRTNTLCEIPIREFGIKLYYTAADLGLDRLTDINGKLTEEARTRFVNEVNAELGLDLSLIYNKLITDYPYYMYWAGKTYLASGIIKYRFKSDGSAIYIEPDEIYSYPLYVSAYYSASGVENTTECKADFGRAVTRAVTKAQEIVSHNSHLSDFDKLKAYKNEICSLTDYNYDADNNASMPYGRNPWQIIWVFDGDKSTRVQCAGYSKAFKYLCDLSNFDGNVSVSLVSGVMYGGTGAGEHMWNLVTLGGIQYLADITNCDEGAIGYPDDLFMTGYNQTVSNPGGDTAYIYLVKGEHIRYVYDSIMYNLYAADDLIVSDIAYVAPPEGSIYINAKNFPDDNFRFMISTNFDTNHFGYLSPETISSITNMNCSGMNISSLKGIELFERLRTLDYRKNRLTVLDISGNTKLTRLNCEENQLAQLNTHNNTSLVELRCGDNQIKNLDLSRNSELNVLACSGNLLTDISVNYRLTELHCQFNPLKAIDVSKSSVLTNLVKSRERKINLTYEEWGDMGRADGYLSVNNTVTIIAGDLIIAALKPLLSLDDDGVWRYYEKGEFTKKNGCC